MYNPVGFKRAISNIINNAVEAIGDNDGTVAIQSHQVGGKAIVSITDSGPGIKKELVEILGKKEVTTKSGGNGIGVLSAQKYMDFIKGALRIETGT